MAFVNWFSTFYFVLHIIIHFFFSSFFIASSYFFHYRIDLFSSIAAFSISYYQFFLISSYTHDYVLYYFSFVMFFFFGFYLWTFYEMHASVCTGASILLSFYRKWVSLVKKLMVNNKILMQWLLILVYMDVYLFFQCVLLVLQGTQCNFTLFDAFQANDLWHWGFICHNQQMSYHIVFNRILDTLCVQHICVYGITCISNARRSIIVLLNLIKLFEHPKTNISMYFEIQFLNAISTFNVRVKKNNKIK